MQNSDIYLSLYLFCLALLARSVAWGTQEHSQNHPSRSSVVTPRTFLLTTALCFSFPQGNSLWHPQWALQVWCHPGKLNLCLLCRDNQGGSHPSGFLCSGWRWPACFAPARDSRTGPDVSKWGQRGCGGADAEELKRAMFGKIKMSISTLLCRYLKEDNGSKEKPKGIKTPSLKHHLTVTTGACSYHTPLAELGFNLAYAGSLPLPLHPSVTTHEENSSFVHVWACLTGEQILIPPCLCQAVRCCLAQSSLATHTSCAQTRRASGVEASGRSTIGELQQWGLEQQMWLVTLTVLV